MYDDLTLGFVDLMRDESIQQDRNRGVFFTQDEMLAALERLGASVAQAQAPTGLGKYLMRSPWIRGQDERHQLRLAEELALNFPLDLASS